MRYRKRRRRFWKKTKGATYPKPASAKKKTLRPALTLDGPIIARDLRPVNRHDISILYGGIDEDVCQCFFQLSSEKLKAVFDDYASIYGAKKREYAKHVYEKWKSGSVEMSGQICERLLKIVPRHLDFDDKYSLVAKLWMRRSASRLKVEIAPTAEVEEALGIVLHVIGDAYKGGIPDILIARMAWLVENDAAVAQMLFQQVVAREFRLVEDRLRSELATVLQTCRATKNLLSIHARTMLKIPGGVIELLVSGESIHRQTRSMCMSSEQSARPPSGEPSRDLVPTQNRPPAPIQDPNNLLAEALRQMPEQKQAEIISKAADEALRLQVKSAENKLNIDALNEKADLAARVARDAENKTNIEVQFSTEHKTKEGDTQITVRTKPEARGIKGSCFVATACFGDENHPYVTQFRQFRDKSLLSSCRGQAVVEVYYSIGPQLAEVLNAVPALKPPSRLILRLLLSILRWSGRIGSAEELTNQ